MKIGKVELPLPRKKEKPSESPKTEKKKRSKAGRVLVFILNAFLTCILVGIITAIIVGCTFAVYVKNNIVLEVDIEKYDLNITSTTTTTTLYYYDYTDRVAREGTAVEMAEIHGAANSIYVPYEQIPQALRDAFIAIEDHRFMQHKGVDWYRTIGAGVNFFLGFMDEFGASTITQQLIKNVSGEDDYKIQRKIQEIFWALDLEKQKSKEDILTLYMNIISLAQNCYGVQAAANTYFGKDVSELTLNECACIAGITKNPSKYNPITHPEENDERRRTVLTRMLEVGKITQEEYDAVIDEEIVLNYTVENSSSTAINSWYTDMVIEDVMNDLVEAGYTQQAASMLVYSGGLKIYTCMDKEVQDLLDDAYKDGMIGESETDIFPAHTSGMPAQSSMIIIDPYTGDILGVAGKRGEKTGNRIQNYATQTVRPAGSSIKPVSVYAPALEAGLITYATVYDDTPYDFGTDNATAWPSNLPSRYDGLTNINSAISSSKNTIAVKVLNDLTLDYSFDFCKNYLQMDSLIDLLELSNGTKLTDKGLAALALGQQNYGVTVREITAAYGMFTNAGIFNEAKSYLRVEDASGKVILENDDIGTVVLSEENAAIMTKMLTNVVTSGTASKITLKSKVNCAGKTGTTSNDYDRWFIGYTPYYIGGVWYGYEYPKSLANLSSNPCITIWDSIMTELHQKYIDEAASGGEALKTFETPDTVVRARYCRDSGLLMTEACYADPRGASGSRAEWGYFAKGTEPKGYCTTHVMVRYDSVTGAVASDCCPSANIVNVGLLNIEDRNFPVQVTVTDAQYVWRSMADTTEPGGWWGDPFFVNQLGGLFAGTTNVEKQYNQFCWEHFDFDAFKRGLITSWGKQR